MQNLVQLREDYFVGMCDRYPAQILEDGLLALATNVIIDQGRIAKRKGTNSVAPSLGAHAILGLSAYEPAGGTKYLIANLDGSSNAQLYSWAGSGSFATLGSANLTKGAQMNFVQASNLLYGFNGTDVVSVNSSLVYTKNPATVPQGTYASWFHNYLLVANTSGFPNRLFWSNLGDPTTFTNTDYIDINPNDGDEITGLAIFNDSLYVFKNNTIWTVTGFSGSSFSVTTALSQNTNNEIYGFGTPSQKSIVSTGKDLYYLSFAGGTPHFRSFVQTQYASTLEQGVISLDIENTMNGLQKSSLSMTSGAYDGKYIYWSVPNGGSSFNNFTIVLEPTIKVKGKLMTHRSWTEWSGFNAAQFAVSDIAGANTIYFGDGTTTGNVNQLNYSTFTDNGTAVSMEVRTRDYQFDFARKGKWKYVYFDYKTGSGGTLTINARIDEAVNFNLQQTLSLAGNSPGLGPTGTFTLGVSVLGGTTLTMSRVTLAKLMGHHMQLQFLESTVNNAEIQTLAILGLVKGYRQK